MVRRIKKEKGIILIFSLLVVFVLSALLASLYFQSINENLLARRSVDSIRAFWLAEAGIAQAINNIGSSPGSGYLNGNINHAYSYIITHYAGSNYYSVQSTGTVRLPTGQNISRQITATVLVNRADPGQFPYALGTSANGVNMNGNVKINGYRTPDTPADCGGCYAINEALNFTQLFSISKATIKTYATVYDNTVPTSLSGINWIDVPSGTTLNISSNIANSSASPGILIINGNVKMSGTVNFYGIIYVIGQLDMRGTVNASGSILAESAVSADPSLQGDVSVNFSAADITNALNLLDNFSTKRVVSWKESG